jgi:hypothetical protein
MAGSASFVWGTNPGFRIPAQEHEVLQAQELYAKKVAQSECGGQGVNTRLLMGSSRTCDFISSAVP